MKHVNSFAIGILALFLSGQIFASDAGHTSEAMEHAGQALAGARSTPRSTITRAKAKWPTLPPTMTHVR